MCKVLAVESECVVPLFTQTALGSPDDLIRRASVQYLYNVSSPVAEKLLDADLSNDCAIRRLRAFDNPLLADIDPFVRNQPPLPQYVTWIELSSHAMVSFRRGIGVHYTSLNRLICEKPEMAVRIRGSEVKNIRSTLGLNASQFATVLGVHASTVHRWEAQGEGTWEVDGVPANVLIALRERLRNDDRAAKQASGLGNEIVAALGVGGALVGLAILLSWLTESRK